MRVAELTPNPIDAQNARIAGAFLAGDFFLDVLIAHKFAVWGAQFSGDESRILTWSSDGTARLWNLPSYDDIPKKKLILYLELNTGTRLTDFGELQVLSPEEWWKLKKELRPVK